ncbi:Lipopolysaccharide core heptosyltransferase III [hydrothermal vent metagenome]|uniref:Lipopolysaccharide core heptosyltransferase III n=1 Tax=hydrothermal vent metagenome TaxID=652676 RepID=A0A3B1C750_9ZZZZ
MKVSEAKRVLIIRLSSLGDVLLTTPVIRSLKKNYPDLTIDFLIKKNFEAAIQLNPNIDSMIIYNDSPELTAQLKENNYDLIIDLHNNFRTKKIVKQLGLPCYKFIKPNLEKFLLIHTKINLLKDKKTITVRYAEIIPEFQLDDKGLELFIPENVHSELEGLSNVVGFAPGAFHYTKRWPIEYYAELGNKLNDEGYTIVILGGESDKTICSDLQKMIPDSLDLSNNNDLSQTAVHIKHCKVFICNDSGLMHTASAVGTPVISIFGSTVQEFGFAPYRIKSIVVENNELKCRPCTHIGKSKCPRGHFKCMKKITPDRLYEKFNKFLEDL